MEIERPVVGGTCIGTIDVRISFQITETMGRNLNEKAQWIEGSATVNAGPRLSHDPGMDAASDSSIEGRNSLLIAQLWRERLHTCRMPRPEVEPNLQAGADIGTMQAITAALVIAIDQSRR